tara:strand:- start:3419 stop:3988 length:570 start_codon:yes stop_codon:yes gene_type:complete
MSFVNRYGGRGLGSLDRALASRMTIRDAAKASRREGFEFGPKAQSKINRYYNTFIGEFGGDTNINASGLAAVQRAMAAGHSAEDVQKRGRREGVSWGPKAADYFASLTQQQQAQDMMGLMAQYQPPAYEAPTMPTPKAMTSSSSAVGGSAKGVKIKRSGMDPGTRSGGTRSLNRKARNKSMQISNLNLA